MNDLIEKFKVSLPWSRFKRDLGNHAAEPMVKLDIDGCITEVRDVELLYRGDWPRNKAEWLVWYKKVPSLVDRYLRVARRVTINLDTVHLLDPNIIDCIEAMKGWSVGIEWTERRHVDVDAGARKAAAQVLLHLRNVYGFKVLLDDMGSGEDSLSRLTLVTPDAIKLDGELLQQCRNDAHVRGMVRNQIQAWRKNADFELIAEWVETPQDWLIARLVGADSIQGFLLTGGSKNIHGPRSITQLEQRLKKDKQGRALVGRFQWMDHRNALASRTDLS